MQEEKEKEKEDKEGKETKVLGEQAYLGGEQKQEEEDEIFLDAETIAQNNAALQASNKALDDDNVALQDEIYLLERENHYLGRENKSLKKEKRKHEEAIQKIKQNEKRKGLKKGDTNLDVGSILVEPEGTLRGRVRGVSKRGRGQSGKKIRASSPSAKKNPKRKRLLESKEQHVDEKRKSEGSTTT